MGRREWLRISNPALCGRRWRWRRKEADRGWVNGRMPGDECDVRIEEIKQPSSRQRVGALLFLVLMLGLGYRDQPLSRKVVGKGLGCVGLGRG